MLKAIARGGAQSSPILLRCGRVSRNFSHSAAAVQEPVASVDKNAAARENRISRMEEYVRRHWAESGTLPKAYILTREFGGARNIAPKVLERLEPELIKTATVPSKVPSGDSAKQSSTPAAESNTPKRPSNASTSVSSSETTAASPGSSKTSETSARPSSSQAKATSQSKAEGGGEAELKEPGISLWEKLHNVAYAKAASKTLSGPPQGAPPMPLSSTARQSVSDDSTEEDDSESGSDSGGEVELPPGSEDKNPAQPLFRSDLQPRHGLYVKFLSPQATDSDVADAFRSCGEINRIQVVRSRNPAARYIYGFVDFKTEEGLNAALRKEIQIRGIKVQTEPQKNSAVKDKAQKQQKQETESDDDNGKPNKNKIALVVPKTGDDLNFPAEKKRCTLALESIPHASLPQIIEALSQYGEVVNSQTKQLPGGNTTAYVEFKNEIEKDTALAASKVILGGKSLKLSRVDTPLTTVVRLSNIPPDSREKIASSYKSYGQVDKVDPRMDGVVDIYYNPNEGKNMAKILDKLNGLQVNRRKLRAVPAPVSYPKTMAELAETPEGQKWIESQRETVRKNLTLSLSKAAMYSRDFEQFLSVMPVFPSETAAS